MSSVKLQKPAPSFAVTRKRVANRIWQNRYIYLMVIPVLVYMILLKYVPMYFLRASFYDYKLLKGFEGSKFVGLKWFERLLSSPDLWQYIKNTLSLNLLSLAIVFPAPLIFAILLNEIQNAPYKKIVQTVSYLPHFISTVVLVSMINTICSPSLGVLAKIYKSMGLTPVNFMGNPDYFYGINIISGLWQGTGWNAVIYISAIAGIDHCLYEAARIDGATDYRILFQLVIPLSKPVLATVALWLIVGHWNDYLNPLVLIHSQDRKTLQLFLKELVLNAESSTSNLASVNDANNKGVAALSQQLKNGVLVVSMVPMIVLYPFLQKFFVSGVMLGSVKG